MYIGTEHNVPPPPLDGLTVLDLSHALAGPYCTMLMAAYGATVIKVEDPRQGDIGRAWAPPSIGGESAFFLGLNAGKQALALDLKDPRGRAAGHRLIDQADVLVENFRPGTLARLGFDYEASVRRNPRLVYCSISGYGQTGPRRHDPAMDLILQASAGLISITGTKAGETVRSGHSVADITAGMFGLIGILMALEARHTTGRGQLVDVSMFDGMISAMASSFANFFGSGRAPGPLGTAFATIVPYACFPTADRDIAIAVGSDKIWRAFCQAIGRREWRDDPRFVSNGARVEHRGVLEPLITETLQADTAAAWLSRLATAGVPCSAVNSLTEVVADPQAETRGLFPTVQHPTAGPVRVTGLPFKLSACTGAVVTAAPRLGEHSRQILGDRLGYPGSAIDELMAAGVSREPPG